MADDILPRQFAQEMHTVGQPGGGQFRLQIVDETLIVAGDPAGEDQLCLRMGGEQRQRRRDQQIDALLRADPAKAADQHRIRVKAKAFAQGPLVGSGMENLRIDAVHDDRRRAFQIAGRLG